MESKIDLENLDPVDLYGVNEQRLEHVRTMFPKIKLVARGNQIKVLGEAAEVERFTVFLDKIKRHYATYNSLSDTEWDSLLSDNTTKASLHAGGGDVILFSTTGTPIRPRSETQMQMVKEFDRNDLLFAHYSLPSGCGGWRKDWLPPRRYEGKTRPLYAGTL